MPRLPGISHLRAIRAFERAGFKITRAGAKHTIMRKGNIFLSIPRHDPVNAFTMAGVVLDSGLTLEEFKKLL